MSRRLAMRLLRHSIIPGWLGLYIPFMAFGYAITPKPGEPAPPIVARTIEGKPVDSSEFEGRVLIIQFVGTDHPRANDEIQRLAKVLRDSETAAVDPVWLIILSKSSDPSNVPALKPDDADPIIVHDADRGIFGRYDVVVLPTIVVVDNRGIVNYALPGPSIQFDLEMKEAILFAGGKISREDFENALHPENETEKRNRAKAEHLAQLAQKMIDRGMADSAGGLLEQAVSVDPKCLTARIGLGEICLSQKRFGDAATQFEKALEQNRLSIKASLGLVSSLIMLKPDESAGTEIPLRRADQILGSILERNPSNARAHYLKGLILERQEDLEQARKEYRNSVELLLEENGIWHQ